jgi:hypothetical protein
VAAGAVDLQPDPRAPGVVEAEQQGAVADVARAQQDADRDVLVRALRPDAAGRERVGEHRAPVDWGGVVGHGATL